MITISEEQESVNLLELLPEEFLEEQRSKWVSVSVREDTHIRY